MNVSVLQPEPKRLKQHQDLSCEEQVRAEIFSGYFKLFQCPFGFTSVVQVSFWAQITPWYLEEIIWFHKLYNDLQTTFTNFNSHKSTLFNTLAWLVRFSREASLNFQDILFNLFSRALWVAIVPWMFCFTASKDCKIPSRQIHRISELEKSHWHRTDHTHLHLLEWSHLRISSPVSNVFITMKA